MKKFFITISHHSMKLPKEVEGRLAISKTRLLEIAEPETEKLFSWPDIKTVKAEVHQCFPNLNRRRNNMDPGTDRAYPPARALFPTFDFHEEAIYKSKEKELSEKEKEELLKKYYDPFFEEVNQLIKSGDYDFFIDAHAMNNCFSSYDDMKIRPDICLGNRGNERGEVKKGRRRITFPSSKMRELQKILTKKGYDVALNDPFSGGYIIQKYNRQFFPGFQVEVNKRLFMDCDDGKSEKKKVEKLKNNLKDAILEMAEK